MRPGISPLGEQGSLILQEVKLDEQSQARIQKVLSRRGYSILFGAPTPRLLNSRGRLRLDMGRVPGVACIYKSDTQAVHETPLTPNGQALWKKAPGCECGAE